MQISLLTNSIRNLRLRTKLYIHTTYINILYGTKCNDTIKWTRKQLISPYNRHQHLSNTVQNKSMIRKIVAIHHLRGLLHATDVSCAAYELMSYRHQ